MEAISRTPRPPDLPLHVWLPKNAPRVEVVGESYHPHEIRALLPAVMDPDGEDVAVQVAVRHDTNNRYDKNAIEIRASTGVLGHLAREAAEGYCAVLDELHSKNMTCSVTARVWGRENHQFQDEKARFVGSVWLELPAPHMILAANQPPDVAHELLPIGKGIQVTGEDKNMSAITPFLTAAGECWVYATLHSTTEKTVRSQKELVEVQIDGQTVGRLSPKMSTDMLPVINFLSERGKTTTVRAIVKGTALKADVVVYVQRAAELLAGWSGQAGTVQPPPKGAHQA